MAGRNIINKTDDKSGYCKIAIGIGNSTAIIEPTTGIKFNINVNAVLPGYFNTDMNKKSYNNKSKRNKRSSLTMLSRWGKMNELVGTIIFLATNEIFPTEACKLPCLSALNST